MTQQYVEGTGGAYRLAGTRISLDSIVHAFWRGQTAESIAQSFPGLTLEQVYGALTFYLANRAEVEEYLRQAKVEFETMRKAAQELDPMFYRKLADARRHSRSKDDASTFLRICRGRNMCRFDHHSAVAPCGRGGC